CRQHEATGGDFVRLPCYKWGLNGRIYVTQDWVRWVLQELADEVVFVGDWSRPQNETSYRDAVQRLQGASKTMPYSVLVSTKMTSGEPADLRSQMEALWRQSPVNEVLINVQSNEDIKSAEEFLAQMP
ncbi:MAG: hypothetical protein GW893_12885, partial [Armatimonadetes bacterium]|nr:hypothetical protein [Armatimonadota bacterium]